jgi:calcineurin-like phosphoesterase family protein
MNWFFTSDEHYDHQNIIEYCNRPFHSTDEMNETLITNHNAVVKPWDRTIHAGDFTLRKATFAHKVIDQLNGTHIFLQGSHDYWLPKNSPTIWARTIKHQHIVVCHYAMRTWAKSHFNSWQLYGHSHGRLPPEGKQWDIGVDNNNYTPISFDQIVEIMKHQPDNFNFINRSRG